MVPTEDVLKDIETFKEGFEKITALCNQKPSGDDCYLLYFQMVEAWDNLSKVVEFNMNPLTSECDEYEA